MTTAGTGGRSSRPGCRQSAPQTSTPAPPRPRHLRPPTSASGGLEIIFRPDPTIWDGRFANNGWLQELPKPLTKITWDPTAWVSPRLAEQQKLDDGDVIELRYRGNTAKLPVAIVPGHPDNAVTVFFGYGRQRDGSRRHSAERRGEGVQRLPAAHLRRAVVRRRARDREDRRPLRARADAGTPPDGRPQPGARRDARGIPRRTRSSSPEMGETAAADADDHSRVGIQQLQVGHVDRPERRAPAAAPASSPAVAENNIPVVGKDQVDARPRDALDPHRPLLRGRRSTTRRPITSRCRACSARTRRASWSARSAATTHSAEGLNDMVYNRCVGTRYCSNNCPYKVRRFNFLLYQDWDTPSLKLHAQSGRHGPQPRRDGEVHLLRAAHQRGAHRGEERATGQIQDGEIVTACQPACPADAIVFGDLERSEQPRREAEGAAARLRAARGAQHAAADDVPGGAAEPEPGARVGAERLKSSDSHVRRSTDGSETRNLRHAAAHRARATRSARSPTRSAASS